MGRENIIIIRSFWKKSKSLALIEIRAYHILHSTGWRGYGIHNWTDSKENETIS